MFGYAFVSTSFAQNVEIRLVRKGTVPAGKRQRAETAENMEQHLPPYAPEQSSEEYFPREMSELDRRIMLMFYAGRYQISEIARELWLSEAAVKKRLERLRKRLKDLSKDYKFFKKKSFQSDRKWQR